MSQTKTRRRRGSAGNASSHLSRGKSHICSFLWQNQQLFQAEMENLKLVESVLDGLIKSCSQQLFEVTDNLDNAAYPFSRFPRTRALDRGSDSSSRWCWWWCSLTSAELWPTSAWPTSAG